MALIVLCAMPVFASTPEQDMVLIVDEGDGDFSGLQQVSDEQLAGVEGNYINSISITHDTDQYTNEIMKRREMEREQLYKNYILKNTIKREQEFPQYIML